MAFLKVLEQKFETIDRNHDGKITLKELSEFLVAFGFQAGQAQRFTWNPAESRVCNVSRQRNVVHQAVSVATIFEKSGYMYRYSVLLIRLLTDCRRIFSNLMSRMHEESRHEQGWSDFKRGISGGRSTFQTRKVLRNTLTCKQIWFFGRLIWNSAESLVCGVFKQMSVLHQATSCFSCYDIREIVIHLVHYS
ncbi:hypothetical protein T265_06887 [Opisthorchis viverrini]|uniref:EF-hand domain-containing protein n=1 Tax=Opisthorchis viverrini TaxID=6198 RepID=A0A075ACY6_OPIVI|nr:hypothetical protein T265_06887 [Opisthorchis viverrini]KER25714.1 hypothetical protein T265_06887 [Opisthorchis viverrini]